MIPWVDCKKRGEYSPRFFCFNQDKTASFAGASVQVTQKVA